MTKVWVKLMVLASTGEKHRVLNSVFKVRQIIQLDMLYMLFFALYVTYGYMLCMIAI